MKDKQIAHTKLSNPQIAENDNKYRLLVENVNSIIMQRKIDGTITFLNEYALKFFGYDSSEIIGRNVVGSIVPPVDSDGRDMRILISKISNNPQKYQFNENQNICKDGRRVWVSWTNKPIRDENGRIIGVLAVGSDITQRIQNESLIKITNALLDLFIKKTSRQDYLDSVVEIVHKWSKFECVGIRLKDETGKIPYVSHLGYDRSFLSVEKDVSIENPHCICARAIVDIPEKIDKEIAIGKHSYGLNNAIDFMAALSSKLREKYLAHCIQGKHNSVMIVPIVYQKERFGILHLADRGKDKADKNMVVFLETVAALIAEAIHRFDVEKKLSESNQRIKTVISCSPIIVFAVDKTGKITLEEGEPLERLGLKPAVGKNFFDVYKEHKDLTESLKNAFEGNISTAIINSFEGYTFGVNYSPVKDDKGNLNGMTGVALDITERVKAQQKVLDYQSQLRSLTAELVLAEQKERRRISEQLHDCLGPIISHSARELGILEKKSPKDISQSLRKIQELLRDVAKRTRSITFEISPPSLYNFGFQFAVEELAEEFEKTYGIKISFECKGKPKKLAQRIEVLIFRSVRELMLNIIKHSKAQKAGIFINMLADNLEIIVSDNGNGFDVANLNSAKGNGFGLFSIRERLTHIGGFMNISSDSTRGTTVVMHIPFIDDF